MPSSTLRVASLIEPSSTNNLMGRTRYRFGEHSFPHFLTCTVVGWLPVFTRPDTVQILLDSWQFLQDHNRLVLLGYVVLENHIHFIASADNLAKEVGDFKSHTARRIIDYLSDRHVRTLLQGLEYHKARHKTDRLFQFWQEGSQPKVIETEATLRQKLEYIHNNPVKRGYVSDATHWRYSSARNYARMESLVDVATDW
jgi:putative transposase